MFMMCLIRYSGVKDYLLIHMNFFSANEYGLFKPDKVNPVWLQMGHMIKDYSLCNGVSGG